MSETGEGPSQPPLTDRQRANLRPLVAEAVLTERATTNERVRRARERIQLGNLDAATEELAESPSEIVTKARERLGEFGVTHNAQGDKTRTVDERRRFNDGNAALDRVAGFLERGFERLNQNERNILVNHVRDIFINDRTLGDTFRRLNPTEQYNQIQAMLQDPEYAKLLATQIDKVNDLTLTSQSSIGDARIARGEAEGKDVNARGGANRTRTEVTDLRTRLQALRAGGAPVSPQVTAAAGRVTAAEQARDAVQLRIDNLEPRVEAARQQYEQQVANNAPNNVQQQFRTIYRNLQQDLNNEARTLQNENTRVDNAAGRLEQIMGGPQDNREDALQEQLQQQYTQLDEARIARHRSPEELRAKRVEERELSDKRTREENQINRHLENALSVATRKYLHDKVRQAVGTLEELEPGHLTEEVSTVRKAMGEAIRTRWLRNETRRRGLFKRRVTEQVVDRNAVARDFRSLLAGGPDSVLRNLLTGLEVRYPGTTASNTPTHQLTPLEADDLMRNKVFIDEMRAHYTKNVLANRILIDQIRPAEVHQIMEADWGKGMIKAALDKNTEFRESVAQLTGSNDMDLDDPSFRHRLARHISNNPQFLIVGSIFRELWRGLSYDSNKHLASQVAA